MAPESSYGPFEHVSLKGRNVGAAMPIRHGGKLEPEHCCRVNIYVNNNIQGVNNSILLGSEVKMRDPGVCIFLDDLKFGKRWNVPEKQKTTTNDTLVSQMRFLGSFALAFLILLFLFSF